MRSIQALLLGLSLVATRPGSPARAQSFPSDSVLSARIRALVTQRVAPGIVLGLLEADGGRRYVTAGTGGPDAHLLGPRSLFEIGSVNKTFTATLLAELVARGEISLSDPVAKFLPDQIRVPQRNGREITLLDLATHRSGLPRLPDYTPADRANPYADFTPEKLYEFLSRHELRRDPGAEYEYSNLGFGLLGHALARAGSKGRKSYHEVLHQRVLEPIGLKATTPRPTGELARWVVKGFNDNGDVLKPWDAGEAMAGAGGLRSNAEDLLTYLAANIAADATKAGTPLQRGMHDAHLKRAEQRQDQDLGLAWSIRRFRDDKSGRIIGHTGGTAGFKSFIGYDPDRRIGLVLLANGGGNEGPLVQLAFELLGALAPEKAVAESVLRGYVGEYELGQGGRMTVTLEEGVLYGQPAGQSRVRLFAETESEFSVGRMNSPTRLRFARDASGTVTGLTLVQPSGERPARKIR